MQTLQLAMPVTHICYEKKIAKKITIPVVFKVTERCKKIGKTKKSA